MNQPIFSAYSPVYLIKVFNFAYYQQSVNNNLQNDTMVIDNEYNTYHIHRSIIVDKHLIKRVSTLISYYTSII